MEYAIITRINYRHIHGYHVFTSDHGLYVASRNLGKALKNVGPSLRKLSELVTSRSR